MSKNDEMGLVPKLRFPEFAKTGEWGKLQLNEIANRITDKVGNKKLTTLSISAGVGFVSQVEKFSRDISGKQYENYIYLKKGDFSYNKGNSKKFPQGCIYELKEYSEAAVPNAFISFHVNENYVSSFYKGYFDSNFHGKQLTRFITSGARSDGLLNISPTDFLSIIFPTPKSKAEQEKIADCLSSLDDIISLEDKKHTSLKEHKKGLMQKLFPADGKTVPELRFKEFQNSPNWETKKIKDTIDLIIDNRGKTPPIESNGIPLIEVNALVSSNVDYSKIKKYVSDETFKNWFRKYLLAGDILFSTVGNTGVCALYLGNIKSAIAQNIIGLRFKKQYNNIFMLNLLSEYKNHKYIRSIEMSAVQPSIKVTQFIELSFNISPLLKEQEKIAECLSSLDDLISAQAEKIGALKIHKKYLMQNLFPAISEVN